MARAMTTCCCPEGEAEHEVGADKSDANGTVVNASCCETRHFDNLATASSVVRAEATNLPAPSWVTVPWVSTLMLEVSPSLDLLTSHPVRAGPPPSKIPKYIRVRSLLI